MRLAAIIAILLLLGTGAAPAAEQQQIILTVPTAGTFVLTISASGAVTMTGPHAVVTPGGVTVPPGDPIPDAPNMAKVFADAIAKVSEPDKVQTAATLKSMLDPILAAATTGALTDVEGAKSNLPFILGLVTMGKADWLDFGTVFKTRMDAAVGVGGIAVVLKAASDELGKVK